MRTNAATTHRSTPTAPALRPTHSKRLTKRVLWGHRRLLDRRVTEATGFDLRLDNLPRRQKAQNQVALRCRAPELLRGSEVKPHVGFRIVGGKTDSRTVHLSQRILRVCVPMLGRQLQPFCRTFVILHNAGAFTQGVAELVLCVHAAMFGGTLQPRQRLLLVPFDTGAIRVHMCKFVFSVWIVVLRKLGRFGERVRDRCRLTRGLDNLTRRAKDAPNDDSCNNRGSRQARDVEGTFTDDPKPLAAISAAIG